MNKAVKKDKKVEVPENVSFRYKINRIFTSKIDVKELDDFRVLLNNRKIGVDIKINLEIVEKLIKVDVLTKFYKEEQDNIFINHIGSTYFYIDNIEDFFNKDLNQVDLPSRALLDLYALSYSHSRALLATELNPTIYKNEFFLPVLDVKQQINLLKHINQEKTNK